MAGIATKVVKMFVPARKVLFLFSKREMKAYELPKHYLTGPRVAENLLIYLVFVTLGFYNLSDKLHFVVVDKLRNA